MLEVMGGRNILWFMWNYWIMGGYCFSHLEKGMELLSRGEYGDALSHFHSAIREDPENYLSYYRRATVYLGLNRGGAALRDLDRVLEIKKEFSGGALLRGEVLRKMGRLDEAYLQYERILKTKGQSQEVIDACNKIQNLQSQLLKSDFTLEELKDIVQEIPWDPSLRELRSKALLESGREEDGIRELRKAIQLSPNPRGFLKLSRSLYELAQVEEALFQVRECLRSDPEHADCHLFYKKLKKIAKLVSRATEAQSNEEWENCISTSNQVLSQELKASNVRFEAYSKLCLCQIKKGLYEEAITACTSALEIKEEPTIYCDRADIYFEQDSFDEAIADYRKAINLDDNFSRAKEGLERAYKLKKKSGKRNYYKILGLTRTATKRDVNKAYRKMAQKWHPDNFQNEKEKKEAENKFMDIAAAKEVLTDDEKRQKFDNGEDPLDPEEQQRAHNPFEGGHRFHFNGDPFSGGSFKFHFS